MIKSLAGKVGDFIYVKPSSDDFRGIFYHANTIKLCVQKQGNLFLSLGNVHLPYPSTAHAAEVWKSLREYNTTPIFSKLITHDGHVYNV